MTVDARRLALGSCPDSWGVWFADDPRQTALAAVPGRAGRGRLRVAGAGPVRLPADGPGPALRRAGPARADGRRRHHARGERAAPGRRLAGDRGQDPQGGRADRRGRRPARGLRAGARLPRRHHRRLPRAGRARRRTSGARWSGRPTSSAGSWPRSTALRLQFHPHADSHVETQEQTERFLADTDPRYVNLCLDTGHLAYRRADSVALIRRLPGPDRLRAHQADGPGRRGPGRAGGPGLRPGGGDRRVAASRRRACPTCPRSWRHCPNWTPSCSSWSSRTCTRSTSTCRRRSPPGPGTTCAAVGVGG